MLSLQKAIPSNQPITDSVVAVYYLIQVAESTEHQGINGFAVYYLIQVAESTEHQGINGFAVCSLFREQGELYEL